jgi:polyisoprenoid-binding protein YceI
MPLMTERTATATWSIDPANSRVEFRVKQFGIATVRGTFTEFEGALEIGDTLAGARGVVSVASLDTQQHRRDDHLRSPAFFDAERYPELMFESTDVRHLGDRELEVDGTLTMHGVTRPITLAAQVERQAGRISLTATGRLDRGDYGVTPSALLDAVVSDHVTLELAISAVEAE